jgi:hypothetical protein
MTVELHGKEVARGVAESPALASRVACENVLAVVSPEWIKQHCECWHPPTPAMAVDYTIREGMGKVV